MIKHILAALAVLAAVFLAGWKAAGWHRDSLDLVISKAAQATGQQMQQSASASGRELERKLDELHNNPPRELRTEIVKPVFTNVCLSADFVRMYNEAARAAGDTLSGKSVNPMPGAASAD